MRRLTGLAVSPGLAWGPAAVLVQRPCGLRYAIRAERIGREVARLNEARATTARQLRDILAKVTRAAGPDVANLFEAQLLMLDDQLLVPRARHIIAAERVNAEWALDRAFGEFSDVFVRAGDAYLRERHGDVADVVGRLRHNLKSAGREGHLFVDLEAPAVLVADEIPPSLAGQIDRALVLGLAIDTGSHTHHSAILARSMGLPAVAALRHASALVRPGDMVLVDGIVGEIIIDPTQAQLDEARERQSDATRISVGVSRTGTEPVSTADGCAVRFLANVELPSEVAVAQAAGAEGIGLVRTEYLLGTRAVESFDEEAQYLVYRDLVEGMAPHPVTVRTFDVDESQASARLHGETDAWHAPVSSGPLGLRAIRLSLNRRDLFATQLRALVRAARCGPLRILFPFVSSVEELREAKAALRLAQDQVAATGEPVPPIPVGVMIEVPSAALTADLLADEADFFSIGTNDLIQYCLAVDRRDERVAGIFEPLHPAILRIVRQVTRVANRRHRGVAVCGEMAADPGSLLLLLGLGVTEYSMSPGLIAAARDIVRQVGLADLRRLAAKALRMGTAAEIHALVRREFPAFAALPEHRGGRLDKEDEG